MIPDKVLDRDKYNCGFDAPTGELKDIVKAQGQYHRPHQGRAVRIAARRIGRFADASETVVAERQKKSPAGVRSTGSMEDAYRAKLTTARALWGDPMVDQDARDPQFDAMTARLLRREALRRAAGELNTTTGPGLEKALTRVSVEVTEEAAYRQGTAAGKAGHADAAPLRKLPGQV